MGVNETLARRCKIALRHALIGRKASEVFAAPLGERFEAQISRSSPKGVSVRALGIAVPEPATRALTLVGFACFATPAMASGKSGCVNTFGGPAQEGGSTGRGVSADLEDPAL